MPAEHPSTSTRSILILGGGIHGAAVARELVLNGVAVVLADTGDLATGATSKSSRLIHGGLRYLEYGDVRLVRESLFERGKLLKLAPHLVQPLRLFVPIRKRWSGLLRSALGFFKLARTRLGRRLMGRSERRAPRGYWPVRIGLWMYDLFSWGDGLPKSRGAAIDQPDAIRPPSKYPRIDASRYRWMCAYSDAQMRFPERCVFALLTDAEQVAREMGVPFQIIPHATIDRQGSQFLISNGRSTAPVAIQPALIVNCSGAWGDLTLKGIEVGTTPLFAGTKGSHLITRHAGLKAALGDQGVYAETGDRRLAFILPFGDAILVGTTDERWSGPPAAAIASDDELEYLLNVVDSVFGLRLTRTDIESHYSGVRPLPRTNDTSNAAVSRDHSIVAHRLHGILTLTLVGGKLTTFRSVAQQIADRILTVLDRSRTATTNNRILIGGENFPRNPALWPDLWQQWASNSGSTIEEVAALWPLFGMKTIVILKDLAAEPRTPVVDTPFLKRTVRWVIEHEWVGSFCGPITIKRAAPIDDLQAGIADPQQTESFHSQNPLDDLIERRLMLVFAPMLSLAALHDLAECLSETGRLRPDDLPAVVDATRMRLQRHYGRTLPDTSQ